MSQAPHFNLTIMSPVKKILFPTDFSPTAQNAFKHCLILADHYQAKIEVLHIATPEYAVMDIPSISSEITQEKAQVAAAVLHTFVELGMSQSQAAYTFQKKPRVEESVEVGSSVGSILNIAEEHQVDLIVMGTTETQTTLEAIFGSVSSGVMDQAKCPILLIPEAAQWKPTHVVAYASDLSESDPYHFWKATELLSPFQPSLHVINISNDDTQDQVAMGELKKIFSNNTPAVKVSFHQEKHESIAKGLEAFVGKHKIDLLVMYSPQRSWFERLFHQSQTREVALTTQLPLLIIKG